MFFQGGGASRRPSARSANAEFETRACDDAGDDVDGVILGAPRVSPGTSLSINIESLSGFPKFHAWLILQAALTPSPAGSLLNERHKRGGPDAFVCSLVSTAHRRALFRDDSMSRLSVYPFVWLFMHAGRGATSSGRFLREIRSEFPGVSKISRDEPRGVIVKGRSRSLRVS